MSAVRVLYPSAAVRPMKISMARFAAAAIEIQYAGLGAHGHRDTTLWYRELDAFVACATQGIDGLQHRPLVRGGGLDVVICTPDVSATFRFISEDTRE